MNHVLTADYLLEFSDS